jgi:phosphoribosylformylglycinamidine synthase subunit PurL
VRAVHRREPAMEPVEVMTSESQERMLAIVAPDDLDAVHEVCTRWEVRSAVIGIVTAPGSSSGGRLRIRDGADGPVLADVPAASLSDDAPLYHRPLAAPADLGARWADDPARALPVPTPTDCNEDLLAMLCDTSWVWRQYDHQLFLNTVQGPGGDAAVLRLAAPGLPASERGLAVSTDTNPRWCSVDPRAGTALTVAESALNVACAGARPVALVNCLNFGNPEHPEVMWQLSEAVDGMAAASRAFGLPVIGGNVSLYNESGGADIEPTPVIAVLGVIERLRTRPPGVGFRAGSSLVLLGATEPVLGGSRWAVERRGHRGGRLPSLDEDAHRSLVSLMVDLVGRAGIVEGAHDVSGGGLGLTLAECAVRSGIGCVVDAVADHAELFAESPSRVVLCTSDPDEVVVAAAAVGVPARVVGYAGGNRIVVEGLVDLALDAATTAWRRTLPDALGEPLPVA